MLLITSTGCFAQQGFSLHAGASIPTGDFGDDGNNNDNGGGASLGFNIGAEYRYKHRKGPFFTFASIDYLNNGLTSKIKNAMSYDGVDITYPRFTNLPIIGGLGLELNTSKAAHLFFSAGIGVNYFSMTDMVLKANGQTATGSFGTSNDFAYKLSIGYIFNQKYTLAINSFGLGDHKLKMTTTDNYGNKASSTSSSLNVSLLTVTFGVRL